jgi:protein gp37
MLRRCAVERPSVEAADADWASVWKATEATPQHTFQILTKRPDRMAEITASLPVPKNVWLGTSAENADYLSRIDDLRKVNSAVRLYRLSLCLVQLSGQI